VLVIVLEVDVAVLFGHGGEEARGKIALGIWLVFVLLAPGFRLEKQDGNTVETRRKSPGLWFWAVCRYTTLFPPLRLFPVVSPLHLPQCYHAPPAPYVW
jgi:hypothetical protein